MKVRNVLHADIHDLLQLEYRFYPEEWHVPRPFVESVLDRNPEVIRVLEINGAVKGHYAFLPLEKTPYEQVLTGTLDEKNLADYTVNYNKSKNVYLYWTTVMVDLEDEQRPHLARCLLNDIPGYLHSLQEKGINIIEIGGIFISEHGVRLARRFGMTQTGMIKYAGSSYPVYRTKSIPLKD